MTTLSSVGVAAKEVKGRIFPVLEERVRGIDGDGNVVLPIHISPQVLATARSFTQVERISAG